MEDRKEIETLTKEFEATRKVLIALGDESRQHMILSMLQHGDCSGMRVNDIASATNLSRPAISLHLQILKDAGIVKVRKEATKNYYYFDADKGSIDSLIAMLSHAKAIMLSLPDRRKPQ
ncbi:MAG: metalloregulator ArsR/SmtB family transcription factor [Eubacteriales bacterium]|nr:metalloregulator ArsR/SmtB family transcription factor [Eubacteriales bacterium]